MKKLIKKFSSIGFIKIKSSYVYRAAIESVNDEYRQIRTVSGMVYTLDDKGFKDFLSQTNFNE